MAFTRVELTKWTSDLRAHPELQYTGQLANKNYTQFCCLGRMNELFDILRTSEGKYLDGKYLDELESTEQEFRLPRGLAAKFGSDIGVFQRLAMPNLVYGHGSHVSVVTANDCRVPWVVIAKHFDDWYPCVDEPRKTRIPQCVVYKIIDNGKVVAVGYPS